MSGQGPRCPVCGARFRGTRECSRCGADLGRLMTLAVRAWRLREAARLAVRGERFPAAVKAAADAQAVCATAAGGRLLSLARCLSGTAGRRTS